MSNKSNLTVAMMGIDIVGLDGHGAIVVRQKWSRGPLEARLAKMPPCLIGMEARVGAHHLSRRPQSQGHDARLMPAKYVGSYSKGQKNDFRDAEAIAEAVQRPTMKFVATKFGRDSPPGDSATDRPGSVDVLLSVCAAGSRVSFVALLANALSPMCPE
jgi:transposase